MARTEEEERRDLETDVDFHFSSSSPSSFSGYTVFLSGAWNISDFVIAYVNIVSLIRTPFVSPSLAHSPSSSLFPSLTALLRSTLPRPLALHWTKTLPES